jgi:DNA-binding NarL/FixJ family response regulator
MTAGGLVSVILVDDHESMLDMLKREFCPENGFQVIHECASAVDAPALCRLLRPDLVIMDVCTEDGASGLDAAAKIRRQSPEVKIIVTTGFEEVSYMPRAKEIGAHGFVYKVKGGAWYRTVALRVLGGEFVFPEPKTIPLPQGEAPFTDREMQVLRLMCKYADRQAVAGELFVSIATVKKHMDNIRQKAGFANQAELIVHVLSNGWINPLY